MCLGQNGSHVEGANLGRVCSYIKRDCLIKVGGRVGRERLV